MKIDPIILPTDTIPLSMYTTFKENAKKDIHSNI